MKCTPDDVTTDGRVFPEPTMSVGWLRLPDVECGIGVLEQRHPDLLEITTTGTSKAGHPVYDMLVTDETVIGPKQKLLVVSSIHGDEIGARGRRPVVDAGERHRPRPQPQRPGPGLHRHPQSHVAGA